MAVDRRRVAPRLPKRVNGKYELKKKIGAGCFGEVFSAVDEKTGEEVAVKLERVHTTSPQLEHGADLYRQLNFPSHPQGFARCLYFGREGDFDCMVLDRLGFSLDDRLQQCKGKFDARTAALIGDQAIQRIEYLHSKKFLHCDIKPENFLFGVGSKVHILYLIDFGLSRNYWTTSHVAAKQRCDLVGTARYASINSHKGHRQSRRDDLEAIGHMLIYFLRGSLPWSGLDARTKREKYNAIKEKKEQVPLSELCGGLPDEFQEYLFYCRGLAFSERPDYDYCRGLFRRVLQDVGAKSDSDFPWLKQVGDNGGVVDQTALSAGCVILEPLNLYKPCLMPDDVAQAKARGFWQFLVARIKRVCCICC